MLCGKSRRQANVPARLNEGPLGPLPHDPSVPSRFAPEPSVNCSQTEDAGAPTGGDIAQAQDNSVTSASVLEEEESTTMHNRGGLTFSAAPHVPKAKAHPRRNQTFSPDNLRAIQVAPLAPPPPPPPPGLHLPYVACQE